MQPALRLRTPQARNQRPARLRNFSSPRKGKPALSADAARKNKGAPAFVGDAKALRQYSIWCPPATSNSESALDHSLEQSHNSHHSPGIASLGPMRKKQIGP